MDIHRRRVAPAFAAAALLAGGCAGDDGASGAAEPAPATVAGDVVGDDLSQSTTTIVKSVADPGPGNALRAFTDAARRDDLRGMWAVLSEASRDRTGPTFAEFAARAGRDFVETVGGFAPGYDVSLSVRTTDTTGAAALDGRFLDPVTNGASHDAFAAGAVKEGGRWRLEVLSPGALQLISPDTQVASDRPVVVVNAESSSPIVDVGIWIDGKQYPSPSDGSPTRINLLAQPDESIGSGRHILVAYASAAAVGGVVPMVNAWTFSSP